MKTLFYILVVSFLFTGCSKKWKKTSETTFSVQFEKSSNSVSYLNLIGGDLNLTSFSLSGIRKKGNAVYFTDGFDTPTNLDVESNSIQSSLSYDIPQGEYTSITIGLRFDNSSAGFPIVIEGTFNDSDNVDIPFVFELEDRIDIDIIATSSTSGDITIVADQKTNPVISINVIDWFSHIAEANLDEAESIEIGGNEYLYINKSYNADIYALILARISKTFHITFN